LNRPPPEPMSRNLAIGIAALLAVLLGAGLIAGYSLGIFSDTGLLKPHDTISSTTSATATMEASLGATDMPPGCLPAATNSSQGYSVEVFLSNSTRVGDDVCVGLVLKNVSGGAPDAQTIAEQLSITDSSGRVVSAWTGAVSAAGTLEQGHYISALEHWNSSAPYGGGTPRAGAYHVHADIKIPQTGPDAPVELTADAELSLAG
jgi:hypothetical protein